MNDKILYNEIGKLIKKERQKKGLTQEQLAKLTNYSFSFIANIESNTYQSFSLNTLYNIAEVLNVSIHNLLPDYKEIKTEDYILICKDCNNNVSIPKELGKFIIEINKLTNNKQFFTCPKCKKNKMELNLKSTTI